MTYPADPIDLTVELRLDDFEDEYVTDSASTVSTPASTSHAVNVPPHAAGDLLLVMLTITPFTSTVTLGDYDSVAWTLEWDDDSHRIAWQEASTTQAGTTTFTVTLGGSSVLTAHVLVIPEGTDVEATEDGIDENPPSLSPSWGFEDTLWVTGRFSSGDTHTILSAPDGYSDFVEAKTTGLGIFGATTAYAHRVAQGDVENPSAWVSITAAVPVAHTIAVRIPQTWTDITSYVYGETLVSINRGSPDESNQLEPGTMVLTLDNRDGRFSPRNPDGPYYGKIGRNTQIRASVTHNSTTYRRLWGEVANLPSESDVSGNDIWVTVSAAGILRRLGQASRDLDSVMKRAIPDALGPDLLAYWPMEDRVNSITLASHGPRARPMRKTGGGFLEDSDRFVSSDLLPRVSGGEYSAPLPYRSATGRAQAYILAYFPEALGSTQSILQLWTTGTIARVGLFYDPVGGGSMGLNAFDAADTLLFTTGSLDFDLDGRAFLLSFHVRESVGNVEWRLSAVDVDTAEVATSSGTWSTTDFGRPRRVVVNNDGGLADTVLGHLAVSTAAVQLTVGAGADVANASIGYLGETAINRLIRLANETDDLSLAFVQEATILSEVMGPQASRDLQALLQECVDADMGLMYDNRIAFGLAYHERAALYNQAVALTLDYSASELAEPLHPIEDDQNTANDVTVQRVDGSSHQAERTEGPLSVPEVGRYVKQFSVNLRDDGQLEDQVGWRLNLGTVDEARFPEIVVLTERSQISGDTALHADVLAVNVGHRITITNPPSWLPPEDIDLLVLGISEEISNFGHTIVFQCAPYAPYVVAEYDDSAARYGALDTTLNEALDTTETGVDVITNAGPTFTEEAGDLPFDVMIGGERMTVTAVGSPTSGAQTLTVTRSVNGVVKTHDSGETVELFAPVRYAL